MTLDEAIEVFEKGIKKNLCEYHECVTANDTEGAKLHGGLAEEHAQLAEWLRELKAYKEQQRCEDAISREAAKAKIKSICNEYRLSYEDGERTAATGGSAYALGHAFDDLPLLKPYKEEGEDKE